MTEHIKRTKGTINKENIGLILSENNFSVTISEEDPGIGLVRGITNDTTNYGLIDITNILRCRGIEKIIYDFSKIDSKDLREWLLEFDTAVGEELNIKTRYIGIKTNELNQKLLNKEHGFHKHIFPNLEYAVKY